MILRCMVCFGDVGTKPKEWFYIPLLLPHAWDVAGGGGDGRPQWHFRLTRLFVWPRVWCHTGTVTTQFSVETTGTFCTGCTEHQFLLLPIEMQEGQGAAHVHVETS